VLQKFNRRGEQLLAAFVEALGDACCFRLVLFAMSQVFVHHQEFQAAVRAQKFQVGALNLCGRGWLRQLRVFSRAMGLQVQI